MSGIVCILHLDDSPVDPRLLRRLTEFQTFRGPDALQVWFHDGIGLGHTLFKTTGESEHEQQPFSLDGNVWIVADARVDGQTELIGKLQAHGHVVPAGIVDAELILRAYAVWDENCVEHLLGDFVFAIWDGLKKRLFCARDQIGVRPMFYAHIGRVVVVSNTLDCIRQHPMVTDKLNEAAIGDFLMYEVNQDTSTSFFSDIRRLPGGHCITWTHSGVHKRRYWTLPIDEPLFYRRQDDYVDQFQELMRLAVGDRLRSGRVAVYMSGGKDSTAVAAIAHGLLCEGSTAFQLKAFTTVDCAIPEERYYAGLVAERLGIPIHYYEWDDGSVNPTWEETPFHTSEPEISLPVIAAYQEKMRQIGSFARVCLEGEGADNALSYEWRSYLSYLFRQRRYGRFVSGLVSDLVYRPRFPCWGRISNKMSKFLSKEPVTPFPSWIRSDFISRAGLDSRWQQFWASTRPSHPVRPESYESVLMPHFQAFAEAYDIGRTMVPMEMRHPFLDLRLMRFLFAVPAIPWCRHKYLIRRAMRGILPDPVLSRRKTGLPCVVSVRRLARSVLSTPLRAEPELGSYIDSDKLPSNLGKDIGDFNNSLRARILNHWLQYGLKTCTISGRSNR